MSEVAITPAEQKAVDSKTEFGFWTYLMTDSLIFATLFATYAVLHTHVAGGEDAKELFSLPFVLVETLILLTSSFTCGLAMLAVHKKNKTKAIAWLTVTFLLGLAFLSMEITEFVHLVQEGSSWRESAFLSSYFTLVGTHGLHILVGLLWIMVMIGQVMYKGLVPSTIRRLTLLSVFWHFLDVVWIFIFTFVYLMGAI